MHHRFSTSNFLFFSYLSKASMSTDQLYFTLTDGSVLGAHPELPKLSTLIAEKQQKSEPISVSDLYIGEKFNLFAEKFFPKYADQLDKLEQTADKEDWWMELIVSYNFRLSLIFYIFSPTIRSWAMLPEVCTRMI